MPFIVRTIVLVTAAAAALAAVAAIASASGTGVEDRAALESRGPIEIASDADFTPANGVRSGSGTASDPFVISRWSIVGSGEYGIEIANVNSEFVIENVLVDSGSGADFVDGLWIANVAGGMIEHVEVSGQRRFGAYLAHAEGTDVCDSVFTSNGFVGLYAHRSFNMTWAKNVASDNKKHGFYLANGSSFNRVTEARSFRHVREGQLSFGIYSGLGANDNRFDNNTVEGNGRGIQVNQVTRNVVRDNTATGNVDAGISITQSTDTDVLTNTIVDNRLRGVRLLNSLRVRVEDNTIRGHSTTGIEIAYDGFHTITRNVIRDNSAGMFVLEGARGNLVFDNLFSNEQNARDDLGGNTWNVSKRAGPNVLGGRFVGGNYWSDLPVDLHDHDDDGLMEAHGPYAFGIAAGGDFLPIASATAGPTAAFTASNDAPSSHEVVAFQDASRAGTYAILNWSWDLGDGARAFGPAASHAYAESGDYRVVLRVRDALGLTSAATRVIAVQNLPPVPRVAGGARVVTAAAAVAFDASASDDPDGSILRFEWSFGDGATATGAVVEHAYADEGAFAAVLHVVDNRLGSASLGLVVVVDRTPPATAAAVTGLAGNRGWLAGDAVVALVAFDERSGVGRTEWRRAGVAEWSAYATPIALGDGVHDVEYRSVDAAGNAEAPRALRVRVDATSPETRYRGPAIVGPAQTVGLGAADATSGVARTFYRLPSDASWRVYEAPFSLRSETEGVLAVRAFSEDAAGNVETEVTIAIRLDATPPALAIVTPHETSLTVDGLHTQPPPAAEAPEAPRVALVFDLGHAALGVGVVRCAGGDITVLAQDAKFLRPDHVALLRLDFAGQQLHERGLARAVRTGQAVASAR